MVAGLEARVFGDRASRAPLSASVAPAATNATAPRSTSTAAADASTPVPTSPPSTGVWQRDAETRREEGLPEKRPRVEALSNSLALPSSGVAAASQPTRQAPWRPDLQVESGRPLTVEDSMANNAYVVATLG